MKSLLYLGIFLFFSACLPHRAPETYPVCYGVEHNAVRESLGIALLDSSWIAFKTWEGATAWGAKEDQPYPCHSTKQVNYLQDTLYCERDSYLNGETFQTVDGTDYVTLKVYYFYRSARSGPLGGVAFNRDTVGWYCTFYDSPGGTDISKAQADSIIKAWGIQN